MIDSRDLRLGNCIKLEYEDFNNYSEDSQIDHNNNIWIVESIREYDIWVYNSIEHISHTDNTDTFEPIPLTEEILLKCGFSITESIFHDNTNAYEIKSWGRIVLINGILQSDEFYFLDGLSTEIKYLHQLQNLYFALTNEELTIQL